MWYARQRRSPIPLLTGPSVSELPRTADVVDDIDFIIVLLIDLYLLLLDLYLVQLLQLMCLDSVASCCRHVCVVELQC